MLALMNKFGYEYRGNNTYVIQEKSAFSAPTNTLRTKKYCKNNILSYNSAFEK